MAEREAMSSSSRSSLAPWMPSDRVEDALAAAQLEEEAQRRPPPEVAGQLVAQERQRLQHPQPRRDARHGHADRAAGDEPAQARALEVLEHGHAIVEHGGLGDGDSGDPEVLLAGPLPRLKVEEPLAPHPQLSLGHAAGPLGGDQHRLLAVLEEVEHVVEGVAGVGDEDIIAGARGSPEAAAPARRREHRVDEEGGLLEG
jgi:hypothetical protein